MNNYFERRYVIAGIFITLVIILLARLFYIQIVDDKYTLYATRNVIRQKIIFPARGPILDRNGKILVQNLPVYDITVIPKEVKPFDTLEFCRLIGVDKDGFDKRLIKARKYSPYRESIFEKQLSVQQYAALSERMSEFPGFDVQRRTIRTYPDSTAAQFLGYISEVNDQDVERSGDYYRPGDYIGRTGVEKSYETILRGQRGVQNFMVDSRGVFQGQFAGGKLDTPAIAGEQLTSSLDIRIQKLGEALMHNKVGSIVAIEPSTGEILCFVSSPTYDPNLMVGRQRGNNMAAMYKDFYRPLLVRPIQAYYPPGSSFKPLDALIALQEGIITPQTTFFCPHYYQAGNHRVGCEHFDGVTDLRKAISQSCNTYFCNVFDRLINKNGGGHRTADTYMNWRTNVNKFGFGVKLGLDLPHERKGLVPSSKFYDNRYHKDHWRVNTIISDAIGQGELLSTPLQMANIECTIANRGFYYTPHLIKAIGDRRITKAEYTTRNYVGIDSTYFNPVIDGMQDVVDRGTAAESRIPGIIMCGKTGTAQNRGKNHSIFVGFAPRDNPKIAIAVIVENGGFGASWAAPIASYLVEKYLRDAITRPKAQVAYIMNKNLLPPPPGYKPPVPKYKMGPDSLKKTQKDTAPKPVILKSVSGKHKKDTFSRQLAAVQFKRREDE
ncbi:penicillin-binding protein 2 [Mucilaginibacter robiniae]|uniref:Penicillin-binding protein 2 n=1 Tax=Mucilaginibacter robiniae TaxID=2728022 RepID=A0A7L5DY21_9SPHI|nr:penicillin-binding protein 2 [Mucilaginibacter robiniae]QJD94929.1 penicillin-binding protein 2 [Mucilaginibacter robiniae]